MPDAADVAELEALRGQVRALLETVEALLARAKVEVAQAERLGAPAPRRTRIA